MILTLFLQGPSDGKRRDDASKDKSNMSLYKKGKEEKSSFNAIIEI
jgi:hypothetical protein